MSSPDPHKTALDHNREAWRKVEAYLRRLGDKAGVAWAREQRLVGAPMGGMGRQEREARR